MHAESWVAPNASLIGQVVLAARASVGHNAVLHGCEVEDDVLTGVPGAVRRETQRRRDRQPPPQCAGLSAADRPAPHRLD
jgi:carbonic anhydrase/acetyltransferase-like protein (isoleucine patch superfamily)